ncbi:type VII secretion target [Gordonia sp. (in: high G+C Gram-positive bacteria)]|jgi:hypothetical protein|uniref:type VII secretion target n=1 Tax=Gordonia sp. (in: high G+C Gram-positive bacteria) TaxID=84139 RepID=UPI00260DDA82|nr:type VII secretion target [Gordonia sp. (in: high G+C Gram-positive bacteria)]HMS74925.1 type VII secretion target [Gordonia sp. (in: high G+C Gram-positive bacteria)]
MTNTQVQADPAAISRFAQQQSTIAGEIRSSATSTDSAAAELAPTFGIIGADFLTVLTGVLDAKSTEVTAIADKHASIGSQSGTAAGTYATTDNSAAQTVTTSDNASSHGSTPDKVTSHGATPNGTSPSTTTTSTTTTSTTTTTTTSPTGTTTTVTTTKAGGADKELSLR